MKKATILLMLMIVCFTLTSQTLKPIIKDSLFCFSIKQSKGIAQYINNSIYCDSISSEQGLLIFKLDSVIDINNTIINNQKKVIDNAYLTIDNTDRINKYLQDKNSKLIKDIRRQKQHKNLAIVGVGIVGLIAILH